MILNARYRYNNEIANHQHIADNVSANQQLSIKPCLTLCSALEIWAPFL